MFGVDSVGVDRICSVTGACNHCGWSVERLAKVDVLLRKVINKQKRYKVIIILLNSNNDGIATAAEGDESKVFF